MAKKNTSKTETQATKPAKVPATKASTKKTKVEPETKKSSALDAAARVLAGTREPMNAKDLVEQMAAKGFWTSSGGKTPHATLHAAISREIKVKGAESRFVKAGPGKFAKSGK
jgi:HB1, ASXL, restriction endonuclease HTH domain